MEPFVLQEEEYFILDHWVQRFPGLTAGFTSKNGGQSKVPYSSLNLGFHVNDSNDDVLKNRLQVADKLDFPINEWIGAQQTHEIKIEKITKADKGRGANQYENAFQATDGFFTLEHGLLLTLCFADCVPLYFFHLESGAIGIAHAGWKGTVGSIAEEMIQTFQSEGLKAKDIFVAIGPSICENCYIVDDAVIKLVQNKLVGVEKKPYNLVSDHQYKLDLKKCNKEILLKAGVQNEHILMTSFCTSCHNDYFYSHRRDNGKTGRMMGFIGWREENQQ